LTSAVDSYLIVSEATNLLPAQASLGSQPAGGLKTLKLKVNGGRLDDTDLSRLNIALAFVMGLAD
jgi:hypothetical protein